jgi:hypothetical protein
MTDRCRSCQALIEWAFTVKGARIPLDIGSQPAANILLDEAGVAVVVPPGQGTRTSHFATCPNADQHRKRA